MKIRIISPKSSTLAKNQEYLTKVQNLIQIFLTENINKLDEGTTIALRDFLRIHGIGFDSIVKYQKLYW